MERKSYKKSFTSTAGRKDVRFTSTAGCRERMCTRAHAPNHVSTVQTHTTERKAKHRTGHHYARPIATELTTPLRHEDSKTTPSRGSRRQKTPTSSIQRLDKVFTQSSLPREEGYLNNALRRVTSTMPSGGLPHPTDAPPPAGFQSCQRQDCHSTNHLRQVADPSRLCHAARRLPR